MKSGRPRASRPRFERAVGFALALLLAAPGCDQQPAAPVDGPRLVGGPGEAELVLPPRLEAAATAGAAGYRLVDRDGLDPAIVAAGTGWRYPWSDRQAPFAVIADLDGDGRDDVALLQKDAGGGRAVVVLDTRPVPAAHELHRWTNAALGESTTTRFYLVGYPAGRHVVPDLDGSGERTLQLPHGGVTLAYHGQAATTFHHANGRFERVTTGD